MELLKFSDSPKNSGRRKNPAGFIGAGIMVAVMGLSSTLAGTITIGTGNTVEFGQGVVTTAACDSAITVTPISAFNSSSDTFTVSSIRVSGIGGSASGVNESACLGKVFEIRAYSGTTELDFTTGYDVLTVAMPKTGASITDATKYKATRWSLVGSTYTKDNASQGISTTSTNDATATGIQATGSSATDGANFTLTGLSISPSITKITVESRSARTGVTDEQSND